MANPAVGDVWQEKHKGCKVEIMDVRGGCVYFMWRDTRTGYRLTVAKFRRAFEYGGPAGMWRAARIVTFALRFVMGAAVVIGIIYALWRW